MKQYRKIWIKTTLLSGVFVFFLLSHCWTDVQAKIRIVTTIQDLASIAREIGGEKVKVQALAKGYQDPHFVDSKPSYLMKLMKADLFIEVGRELEVGWVPPLLNSARNSKILNGAPGFLDASIYIPIIEIPTGILSRAQGDVHPFGNPHYWLDPKNGAFIADAIMEKLSELSPEDTEYFKTQNEVFKKKLNNAVHQWNQKAKELGLDKDPVVTYHKTWSYFAQAFHLKVVDYVELKPGIPPSVRHIRDLMHKMKARGVKWIIVDPYFDIKLPKKIARDTGARLVVLPTSVGAEKNIKTYFDLFNRQFEILEKASQGGH